MRTSSLPRGAVVKARPYIRYDAIGNTSVFGHSNHVRILIDGTTNARRIEVPGLSRAVGLSPDSSQVAWAADYGVGFWDYAADRSWQVMSFDPEQMSVWSLAFGADGRSLFLGTIVVVEGNLRSVVLVDRWDSDEPPDSLDPEVFATCDGALVHLTVSRGQHVAAVSAKGIVYVWSTSGKTIFSSEIPQATSASFSPDAIRILWTALSRFRVRECDVDATEVAQYNV